MKIFTDINEAEAWLDLYNRELQQALEWRQSEGQGVCFTLVHGGELYLHTNGDGDILLDVTPEAAWVQPVLTAVTRQSAPAGQIWLVAGDQLMPLLMGFDANLAILMSGIGTLLFFLVVGGRVPSFNPYLRFPLCFQLLACPSRRAMPGARRRVDRA